MSGAVSSLPLQSAAKDVNPDGVDPSDHGNAPVLIRRLAVKRRSGQVHACRNSRRPPVTSGSGRLLGASPRTRTVQLRAAGGTEELKPHKRSSVPSGDKLLIHAKLLKGFGHAAQTLVTHEAAPLSSVMPFISSAGPSRTLGKSARILFYALLANSCLWIF